MSPKVIGSVRLTSLAWRYSTVIHRQWAVTVRIRRPSRIVSALLGRALAKPLDAAILPSVNPMGPHRDLSEACRHDHGFATTNWTVVLRAQREASPESQSALDRLCRDYWYPLYVYARRRGCAHEDGQDLVQGFLAQLLARNSLLKVAPEKGRFRSFLLASFNYYLADVRDRGRAQKRGGGQEILPMNSDEADRRYRLEPSDERSPELVYERRWAFAIIEQVFASLESEYTRADKLGLYRELQPFLLGDKSHGTYAEVASRNAASEGAIKMAVLRLRERYRELFREAIGRTVESPDEIEAEFAHLLSVIST